MPQVKQSLVFFFNFFIEKLSFFCKIIVNCKSFKEMLMNKLIHTNAFYLEHTRPAMCGAIPVGLVVNAAVCMKR